MKLETFITKRPYLYHLTDRRNLPLILDHGRLLSTNNIIDLSGNVNYQRIKRQKRKEHTTIETDGKVYFIRDQRPISEKALQKCLTDNWSCADFYNHLNDRVFMWPNMERLWKHFNRYEHENPLILRFNTSDVLEANPHVKFSRLNSGATRANSYLGGKPPERGTGTFLSPDLFDLGVGQVAEVTFEGECILPESVYFSYRPDSQFLPVATMQNFQGAI